MVKKVGGGLVVAAALAACAAEPSPSESTTAAALTSLGQPMYARISATTNPNQPKATDRFRIASVQTYWDAFSYQGVTYPYTMVGTGPTVGGTTVVPTTIVPTRFTFEAGGVTLDGNDSLAGTLGSPVFQDASYSVGTTQFGDAVQRATFWNRANPNYHVRLGQPVVRPTLTATIPANMGFAFQIPGGPAVGLIDIDYFYNLVRSSVATSWTTETFPIVLSHNVFLYIGAPQNCCVLGFHDAYVTGFNKVFNKINAQTWTWASYSDLGLFGVPIADVHALSHEVSEWMNDPFGINYVPPWQGNDAYGCSPVLETGDPIVGSAYPVTLNGVTYHPQNEVMLPWFARESPSSAYQGAYTYPDTTVLTTLPHDCN